MSTSFTSALRELPVHVAESPLVKTLIKEHSQLKKDLKITRTCLQTAWGWPSGGVVRLKCPPWCPKELIASMPDWKKGCQVPYSEYISLEYNTYLHILNRMHGIESQITKLALRCLLDRQLDTLFTPVTK